MMLALAGLGSFLLISTILLITVIRDYDHCQRRRDSLLQMYPHYQPPRWQR